MAQIRQPMALPGTYYRLRIDRMLGSEWVRVGFHNQPFRTREEAETARIDLDWQTFRRAPGHTVRITVVECRS